MNFALRARLARPFGQRFIVEWLVLGCLGIAVILMGSIWRVTAGADRLVYDHFLGFLPQQTTPAIVVVEIDNTSLAQLGRWPWPRSTHARLLEALAQAQPAAVVYDVLFTEPTPEDTQLAQALALTPTYLPILLSPAERDGRRLAVLPVAPLAEAAAGLGQINFEVDQDGIVRSVALFEGDTQTRWPQLMLPLFRAIEAGRVNLAHDGGLALGRLSAGGEGTSEGEARFLIPFSRRAQAYTKVSVASVLAGEVPSSLLRGKIVLIGATASGLYDRFATPVSGELGPLPGVYIHAGVLDTLLTGREIYPVRSAWLFLASLAPLALLLAGFLVLSPWRSLLLTGGLCCAMTLASAALLWSARLWLSPVPAIAGLIVVYPVWNWRRLEMTMSYLRQELQRLADEPHLLPETPRNRHEFGGDVLERHMALMAQAAQRMQDMKRFVWDSLDSLPEPILVSDPQGVVLIANHAAKAHFARHGAPHPERRTLPQALGDLRFIKAIEAGTEISLDPLDPKTAAASVADSGAALQAQWPALLDPARGEFAEVMQRGIEVRDRAERDHLLRYAACTNAQGEVIGWIAGLVDVSALHAAERQREDALTLLSHDMRSPQVSIVALIEIERTRIESDRMREVLDRIERYAQRALALAGDFVQLARAESQAYILDAVSLAELVINAADEVWPQAQAKQIQINLPFGEQLYWIRADASLLTRALVNILNNAVKYSPAQTQITCTLVLEAGAAPGLPARVSCTVGDQGYGIAAEQQAHLFERFRRFRTADQPEVGGTGLGMAFVKTVVMRHGGEVRVESAAGAGTRFTLLLPILDDTGAE